ncbi:hypothetical protein L911_3716 [Vibrio fluvialis I21563]|nr:hypothetical protein L911_3716 [Vibrio fluvialis I21563]
MARLAYRLLWLSGDNVSRETQKGDLLVAFILSGAAKYFHWIQAA